MPQTSTNKRALAAAYIQHTESVKHYLVHHVMPRNTVYCTGNAAYVTHCIPLTRMELLFNKDCAPHALD